MKGWLTENSLQLENIRNVFLHETMQTKGRLGLIVFKMNIMNVYFSKGMRTSLATQRTRVQQGGQEQGRQVAGQYGYCINAAD